MTQPPHVQAPQPVHVEVIPSTDVRLNRHVAHDDASWNYPLPELGLTRRAVRWQRHGGLFDQNVLNDGKGLGCCTMCAGYGLRETGPFYDGTTFTIDQVVAGYHEETVLDERQIPGVWPPDDTGSAGLWMAKVLKNHGLISGYRHAFSVTAILDALQSGPVAMGSLWLNSMFEPKVDGTLSFDLRSGVAGGHEYVLSGYDPTGDGWVEIDNSWSASWGDHGSARMRVSDLAMLMRNQGDAIQPTLPA